VVVVRGVLVLQRPAQVPDQTRDPRDPLQRGKREGVAVDLVEHAYVERGGRRAVLVEAVGVVLVVAGPAVGDAVDQSRVAADAQIRGEAEQDFHRGQGFLCRHVARAGQHDVGGAFLVGARPTPHTEPLFTVRDGLVDVEVLQATRTRLLDLNQNSTG